jgi:hypothetical protein
MGSDDASFVQDPSSTPESAVMPVARKASGMVTMSPRDRLEGIARGLLENALESYRLAANAEANGSSAAELFRNIAEAASERVTRALDELASLAS